MVRLSIVCDTSDADQSSLARLPVTVDPPKSCRQKKHDFLEWLTRKRNSSADAEIERENSPPPAAPPPAAPQREASFHLPKRNKRRRDDEGIEQDRASAGPPTPEDARKRNKPDSNRKLADVLIEKAVKGMTKINGKKRNFNPVAIQTIVSRCRELDMGDQQLNTCLENLAQQLAQHATNARGEMMPRVWVNWYYSACVRLVLQWRGRCQKERRLGGVCLLHRIVNNLLLTEGPKALVVLAAYAGTTAKAFSVQDKLTDAEQGHYLSTAARASEAAQIEIAAMVARGLQKQLQLPGEHYLIPTPLWIGGVINMRYAFSTPGQFPRSDSSSKPSRCMQRSSFSHFLHTTVTGGPGKRLSVEYGESLFAVRGKVDSVYADRITDAPAGPRAFSKQVVSMDRRPPKIFIGSG